MAFLSRDVWIYFPGDSFPHQQWESLLSRFDFNPLPTDDLDPKHSVVRKWSATVDDHGVFADLRKLIPERHSFPPGYRWKIVLNCSARFGAQNWLLFGIPLLALQQFRDVIFQNDRQPFLVTTENAIEFISSMTPWLSDICDSNVLVTRELTSRDRPLLPCEFDTHFPSPSAACEAAAQQFVQEW